MSRRVSSNTVLPPGRWNVCPVMLTCIIISNCEGQFLPDSTFCSWTHSFFRAYLKCILLCELLFWTILPMELSPPLLWYLRHSENIECVELQSSFVFWLAAKEFGTDGKLSCGWLLEFCTLPRLGKVRVKYDTASGMELVSGKETPLAKCTIAGFSKNS